MVLVLLLGSMGLLLFIQANHAVGCVSCTCKPVSKRQLVLSQPRRVFCWLIRPISMKELAEFRFCPSFLTTTPCINAAEGDLLADQADSVKEFAEFVSQLRRVGTGLGVFEFDRKLQA